MRYLLAAALIIASVAIPAYAQVGSSIMRNMSPKEESQRKPEEDPPTRSTLENLPDGKFDPWGSVREAPPPKSNQAKGKSR
jgi:hypothetical protein